jgi:hypothetical protein
MAWIVFALDGTLLTTGTDGAFGGGIDEPAGGGVGMPTPGAVEAVTQLLNEGHRVSVWTDRFAPMPEARKQQLKEEIDQELASVGFPPLEIWTGTTKPSADIYIDRKAVTFDDDWGLALAQVQQMLEDQGLAGPDMSGMGAPQEVPDDDGQGEVPAEPEAEEPPQPKAKKKEK